MTDALTIAQAFTSLQATAKIAKTLIGVRDQSIIDAKLIELNQSLITAQGNVMQAQSEQAALIQEVRSLKEQIMKLENWENEKARYQLIIPWAGFYVFALKDSAKNGEPPHWICQKCYEDGRKVILQNVHKNNNRRITFVTCPHCPFEVDTLSQPVRSYV